MVFHGTLLNILDDLVVWMVFTRPPISKSFSPCSNPLVTLPSAPITIGNTIAFICLSFFQLSIKVYVLISLRFLSVLPCSQPERQSPLFSRFSSFVDYHKIWLSD